MYMAAVTAVPFDLRDLTLGTTLNEEGMIDSKWMAKCTVLEGYRLIFWELVQTAKLPVTNCTTKYM